MKASINVEFTDEDLRKYAEDVGRRWLAVGVREIMRMKVPPDLAVQIAQQVMAAVMQGAGRPPGAPGMEAGGGVGVSDEPPNATKCERVGSDDPHLEEGWICHRCRGYNGMQREACRNCAHERCDIIVTPPPPQAERSATGPYRISSEFDLLLKYGQIITLWPARQIDIAVKRLGRTPVSHMIPGHPESGMALYAALMALHGQSTEAEYEVKFLDNDTKQYRGIGRITLPNTLAPSPAPPPNDPHVQ